MQTWDLDFFFLFFLSSYIYSHKPEPFPVRLLPSFSYSPGNRSFAFPILTLDFACVLLKLHLLISGLLGLANIWGQVWRILEVSVKKTFFVKTGTQEIFITNSKSLLTLWEIQTNSTNAVSGTGSAGSQWQEVFIFKGNASELPSPGAKRRWEAKEEIEKMMRSCLLLPGNPDLGSIFFFLIVF